MKISRNLPASIFFKVVEYFFFDELNARKITNKLQNEYNNKIHPYKIEKLLKSFRLLIYYHLKKIRHYFNRWIRRIKYSKDSRY